MVVLADSPNLVMGSELVSTVLHMLEDIRLELVSLSKSLKCPHIAHYFIQWVSDKAWAIASMFKRLNHLGQLFLIAFLMSFWLLLAIKLLFTAGGGTKQADPVRMEDKTVLITGANRGRGLDLAVELASRGARIIIACRNMERGEAALQHIRAASNNSRLSLAKVDLADMDSVRMLASQVLQNETQLDVLICNGCVSLNRLYRTESGLELHMATNYLGFFLLSHLLLSLLVASRGRVIVPISSDYKKANLIPENLNSERHFDNLAAFSNTQLAKVLMTRTLAAKFLQEQVPVTINCVNTGHTLSGGFWSWLTGETPEKATENAVQTALHLASSPDGGAVTGRHFVGVGKEEEWTGSATNDDLGQRLFQLSCSLCDIHAVDTGQEML